MIVGERVTAIFIQLGTSPETALILAAVILAIMAAGIFAILVYLILGLNDEDSIINYGPLSNFWFLMLCLAITSLTFIGSSAFLALSMFNFLTKVSVILWLI